MPTDLSRYRVGNICTDATVLVGDHLNNITFNVTDVAAATELLSSLKSSARPTYRGPLLRRLDPIVLINRAGAIKEIAAFFADPGVSVLYVYGLAGIGKSTLVRGAVELRRSATPAIWISCEGLDCDHLLAEICAGMGLDIALLLGSAQTRFATRIASVLGAITSPGIVVLDGFEALLDEKGKLNSSDLPEVIDAFATLEHKLKVLVTTRQLSNGIGAGSAGIRILHLRGLSEPMAEMLLRTRMNQGLPEGPLAIPRELLPKLGGHPKFIELLASVASELPIERLIASLLAASDIGAFVLGEIFARITPQEMQVLRAALVFRDAFTLDSLKAVYDAIDVQRFNIESPVRALVRRTVLDPVAVPVLAYYLHPILRDAVPRDATQEAAAHAAAAAWCAQTPVVASDLATWEDTLYHLRRTAEVGKGANHIEPYSSWFVAHFIELKFAGWGRRVLAELRVLGQLTSGTSDAEVMQWASSIQFALGKELCSLNENDEAIAVLDRLARSLDSSESDLLVSVKMTLGKVLADCNRLNEAARLADELEALVNASEDIMSKFHHRDLRFQIARKSGNALEMMRWAKGLLESAEALAAASPSPASRDAVAEAHFALGISCVRANDLTGMFDHIYQQLRIKLEIGKVTGVAAGLFNLGAIISTAVSPAASGPLLLTADQLFHERDLAVPDYRKKLVEEAAVELVSDAAMRESARKAIAAISADLLPFFERSLTRWQGIVAAASSSEIHSSAGS